MFESLENCKEGELPKDWGEISYWPRERIERGDWTAAIWRSPELADAAADFAECQLPTLKELDLAPVRTDISLSLFEKSNFENPNFFPSIYSSSEDAQLTIQAKPDEWWIPKNNEAKEEAKRLLDKAGHLIFVGGQDNCAARLVAVASDEKYIGGAWLSVPGLTAEQAKALAVYLNSTPGRLQLIRNLGSTLAFPQYNTESVINIRVPDVINNGEICRELAQVWEETKHIKVPQYRDGDGFDGQNHPREKVKAAKREIYEAQKASGEFVNPRPIWDAAVSRILLKAGSSGKVSSGGSGGSAGKVGSGGSSWRQLWSLKRLNQLRQLLHREPHVRGKSYNEFEDE